jgi:raffinose/stachyose/melibiose transport system permease protein
MTLDLAACVIITENFMDKIQRSKRYIGLFVGPAFVVFFIFGLIPIIYNFILSLYRTDLMSPSVFVGLKNYKNLLSDSIFQQSLRNNLLMVVGSLSAHLPLAMVLSLILFNNKMKSGKMYQSIFFLPCVVCGTAVGLAWTFIYNSQFGLVNSLLDIFNLSQHKHQWLSDEKTVIFAIIIVVMWQYVGYHMVIQLAAMRDISSDIFDAASIDGASKWQQFRCIIFPLIKPILKIDSILIITGSLKYFDLVFVMTGGGPSHASEVLATYMYYQGFRTLKYGYSSAIGNILLLLCVASMIISNFLFSDRKTKRSEI